MIIRGFETWFFCYVCSNTNSYDLSRFSFLALTTSRIFWKFGFRLDGIESWCCSIAHPIQPNTAASLDSTIKPVCCSFSFMRSRAGSLHISYAVLPILSTHAWSSSVISISISSLSSLLLILGCVKYCLHSIVKIYSCQDSHFSFPCSASDAGFREAIH